MPSITLAYCESLCTHPYLSIPPPLHSFLLPTYNIQHPDSISPRLPDPSPISAITSSNILAPEHSALLSGPNSPKSLKVPQPTPAWTIPSGIRFLPFFLLKLLEPFRPPPSAFKQAVTLRGYSEARSPERLEGPSIAPFARI